eukprot:13915207-Alexandrium_andersonii.AAC.1
MYTPPLPGLVSEFLSPAAGDRGPSRSGSGGGELAGGDGGWLIQPMRTAGQASQSLGRPLQPARRWRR